MPPSWVVVPVKYSSTSSWLQADRLEHLGAAVRRDRRDAHLAHHLEHALAERLEQVARRPSPGSTPVEHAPADQVLDRLHREVRVDRGGAVADQQGDVVHLAHVAGLDEQADLGAGLLPDQVVVHGRGQQQRRDRRQVAARVAVGQDDEPGAGLDRLRTPRRRSRPAGPAGPLRRR